MGSSTRVSLAVVPPALVTVTTMVLVPSANETATVKLPLVTAMTRGVPFSSKVACVTEGSFTVPPTVRVRPTISPSRTLDIFTVRLATSMVRLAEAVAV